MAETRLPTPKIHPGIQAIKEFLKNEDQLLGSALFLSRFVGTAWDQQFLSSMDDIVSQLEQKRRASEKLSYQELTLLGAYYYYSGDRNAESRVCLEEAGQRYKEIHNKDYGLALLLLVLTKQRERLDNLEIFNDYTRAVGTRVPNAVSHRQFFCNSATLPDAAKKAYKEKLQQEISQCLQETKESKEADLNYYQWLTLGTMLFEYSDIPREFLLSSDIGFFKQSSAQKEQVDKLLTSALICFKYAQDCHKRDKGIDYKWALLAIGNIFFKQGLHTKAFEHYCRAAEHDLPEAIFYVGDCFENGYGTQQNSIRALECYERSAKMIFPLAFEAALNLLFDEFLLTRKLTFEQQIQHRAKFFRQTHATGRYVIEETKPLVRWVHAPLGDDATPAQIQSWFDSFVKEKPIFGKDKIVPQAVYEVTLGILENKLEQSKAGQVIISKFQYCAAMNGPKLIAELSLYEDSWSTVRDLLDKVLDSSLIDRIYQERIDMVASLLFVLDQYIHPTDLSFTILAYLGLKPSLKMTPPSSIKHPSLDLERQHILNKMLLFQQEKQSSLGKSTDHSSEEPSDKTRSKQHPPTREEKKGPNP